MYLEACRAEDLTEGGFEVAAVDRTLVLIVWPKGGVPRAFQGFCPHARAPMGDAGFDGKALVCPSHGWAFDGRTGRCITGRKCRLAEYPLKIDGAAVMVDVDGVEPNYL